MLIKRGANLVVFANDGGTPLHWAARAGADDTVEVLMDAKAQLEARPNFGLNETVLSFAVRHDAPLSTIKVSSPPLTPTSHSWSSDFGQ